MGHLVQPGVGVHNIALQQLAGLIKVSLALDSVLQVAAGIAEVELHVGLVLLRLDLVGAEAVNLLTKVSHGVVVLHAKGSKGALVSDVQLLKLRLEAGKLALPLLVELHLGGGVGAGLLQPGRDVLDVLLQHGAALLGLGAVSTLDSQLLVKLLKPGLQLLGLLGVLGAKGGLVVDLGGKSAALLVLASGSSLELALDALKVCDGLLGELQVSLDLPLGLLNVSLHLLLPLKGILSLIKSLLQLSLDTGQMVALVLGGLDVLLGLLATVSAAPLLLAELGDHVTLVGDLVLEGADLVVLVGPVLLGLGQNTLLSGDLALQLHHSGVGLGHGGLQLLLGGLLSLDPGVHLVQVLLHIGSLVLNPDGFVDHVLHGGASRLKSKSQLVLLSSKTIVHSLDLGASSDGSVNVGLGLGDLVLVLLLELAELGALEVGLDGQPQLEPEPGLGHHVGPDGTLAGVEGHLLVLQLLELHPGSLTASTSLQPGEDGADLVLTLLLHPATNAGPEEDEGVTQPELLLVQLDDVHHSLGGGLVILGLGDSGGSDDVVAGLELGIGELVGEASAADGNSGKHTVALVLVHHKAGLHTTGDLVGVGHHATDEVGVGLVEGGHQVVQLTLEVGGHGLAALALLPVLVLGSLQGLARVVLEALDGQGVATVLDQLDDGVVEGILVLLQPSGQVVGDGGGVVDDSKVRIRIRARVGLGELGPLAQQVGHEFLGEGGVGGLGEEGLLLKDGKEGHWLFKHVNALLQIHAEVNVGPVQALPHVHLLLKGEHVLVEELLQLLVDVVDADLLETVVVEDLKAGNVEDTNVGDLLHGWVAEGLVTLVDDDPEGTLVDGTGDAGDGVGSVGAGGALLHPLGSDLQLGLAEVGDHPLAVDAQELGNLLAVGGVLDLGLLLLADWHKVLGHVAHVHHASGVAEHIVLHLGGEAKDVEGFVSELHVLLVVNGGDGELTLGHVPVVLDVVGQEALGLKVGNLVGHEVVEGVVATLKGLLVGETGLLEQVDHHVGSRQLSRGVEVDTDELSESGGVVVPHGLGVAPGLKDGVGLDDLVLKGGLSLLPLAGRADGGKVGNDLLGVLGLSSTGLSSNQDGLVDAGVVHALVGSLGNTEDVGPALVPPLADVQLHGAEGVNRVTLVWVNSNAEQARVGVDQLVLVPDHGVPEDASISQEGEVSHVLGVVELGRVDLAHSVGLVGLDLAVDGDGELLASSEGVILDLLG